MFAFNCSKGALWPKENTANTDCHLYVTAAARYEL